MMIKELEVVTVNNMLDYYLRTIAKSRDCQDIEYKVMKEYDSYVDKAKLGGSLVEDGQLCAIIAVGNKVILASKYPIEVKSMSNEIDAVRVNMDISEGFIPNGNRVFYATDIAKLTGVGPAITRGAKITTKNTYSMREMFGYSACDEVAIDGAVIDKHAKVNISRMFSGAAIGNLTIRNCIVKTQGIGMACEVFEDAVIGEIVIEDSNINIDFAEQFITGKGVSNITIRNSVIDINLESISEATIKNIKIHDSKFRLTVENKKNEAVHCKRLEIMNSDLIGCEAELLKAIAIDKIKTDNEVYYDILYRSKEKK